ncbi:MAG: hypothetical protein J6S09_01490 [Paludibacteraceae bacterium]|nr:hypothetical protein [Paludibacteraceae bacterium]
MGEGFEGLTSLRSATSNALFSHGRLISFTDSNDCFTKQEAVKQAEVLGVALSTMERWITKSVQTAHIERLATGLYRKKPSCIA